MFQGLRGIHVPTHKDINTDTLDTHTQPLWELSVPRYERHLYNTHTDINTDTVNTHNSGSSVFQRH